MKMLLLLLLLLLLFETEAFLVARPEPKLVILQFHSVSKAQITGMRHTPGKGCDSFCIVCLFDRPHCVAQAGFLRCWHYSVNCIPGLRVVMVYQLQPGNVGAPLLCFRMQSQATPLLAKRPQL